MKATEANFIQFLQGNDKQFTIPIYQRTYSWTIAQCKQLWDDIIRVASNPDIPGHFIGSIVYIAKGIYRASAINELLVIDGQQRLATLSLLLAALGRAIDRSNKKFEWTGKKIRNYYLVNNEEEGDLHYKLLLTQTDRETLMRIVEGHELPEKASPRLVENYQFFEKQIKESKFGLDTLFTGIAKLIVVDVSLDRTQDNPQLIFESLNSTGLELSQADLIRNFILMGQEPKVQTELYTQYWYPMEQSFGHTEYSSYFDRFMRDYLTIQNKGHIPNIDHVYAEFKEYVRDNSKLTVQEIVADICRYSKLFVRLAFEKEADIELCAAIRDINILRVEVAYPFFLEVFDDFSQGLLKKEEVLAILRLVESYVFRRVLCGIPTNSLNKTFATLSREIEKGKYLDTVKCAFLVKDSYRRFPNDEEVRQQFVIKDVYNFRSRNYLLRKLENYGRTKEFVNVEDYTIEHILPQNKDLSPAWQIELGTNWQQIQARYLHTIGNLTLTGYNSEYSDRPFLEKREYPDHKGFRNSPILLNQYLSTLDYWNEETIQTRSVALAEKAVKIWALPNVDERTLLEYQMAHGELTIIEEIQEYTLEHYEYLKGPMLELFKVFARRVLNLDPAVHQENKKYYIAFKASTNFVDMVPQKGGLRLSLNIPFNEVEDPFGLCIDVSGLGRWGNGDVEVRLSSSQDLDNVMALVAQALFWQMEN